MYHQLEEIGTREPPNKTERGHKTGDQPEEICTNEPSNSSNRGSHMMGLQTEEIHSTKSPNNTKKGYRCIMKYVILILLVLLIIGSYITAIILSLQNKTSSYENIKSEIFKLKQNIEELENDSFIAEIEENLEMNKTKAQVPVCPTASFYFPRNGQMTDYVQYILTLPSFNEFTICMWLETDDYENRSTIFSYAVPSSNNEVWIFLLNARLGLVLSSAKSITFSHRQFEGIVTVHICVWFSTLRQRAGLYLNGTAADSKTVSNTRIQGGGTLILGQDQDSVGGSFSALQSYSGSITNVVIWPRVLTDAEVSNVARACVCPSDHVSAMTSNLVRVFGNAYSSNPLYCPTM